MARVKIQLFSDLHLEAPAAYDFYEIKPQAQYLALLGDIGYVKDDGLFEFIEKQLSKFRLVFFLLGNHEPYQNDWSKAKASLATFKDDLSRKREAGASLGDFILLDQTRYDISNEVTILGCTLISKILASQSDHVSFGLNDFYHIEGWTIEDHQRAHASDIEWLNAQVASISKDEPNRRIVIFTHHSPSIDGRTIDPAHAQSRISSGFSTDLTPEPCWRNGNVKLWAFGHTHYNCDFHDENTKTRIVTNQRGYYFAQAAGFDETMVLEL